MGLSDPNLHVVEGQTLCVERERGREKEREEG